jgi:hypothetical protein
MMAEVGRFLPFEQRVKTAALLPIADCCVAQRDFQNVPDADFREYYLSPFEQPQR